MVIGLFEVMVEFVEKFIGQIVYVDWVMFCKNGIDVMFMVLMIVRVY